MGRLNHPPSALEMAFHPLQLLMPGGRLGRHQVLLFHRVLVSRDPMMPGEPDVDWFDRLIGRLARLFCILPLSEAIERAAEGKLPRASLSITFDDGYADNVENALPVLERHRAHATFFIATGFLNGGRMFNDTLIETARRLPEGEIPYPFSDSTRIRIHGNEDRRTLAERAIGDCKYLPVSERDIKVAEFAKLQEAPLPDNLMMDTAQLQRLQASRYAEIGAHTDSHPILAGCEDKIALNEISQSVDRLENMLGIKPQLFAYPNGKEGVDFLAPQAKLVEQAGLAAAVSTDWGTLKKDTDRYRIPRFCPWSENQYRFVFDLVRARFGML